MQAVLLVFLFAWQGRAADPNAGLPPSPKYVSGEDLEATWGSATLSSLTTNAENGVATAQAALARRYLTGQGTETNKALAIKWYTRAATNGVAFAQNFLGAAYETGNGVQKSMAEAIRWYRLASDQGLPAASLNLAWLSFNEEAPGLQPLDAKRYYELAAEKGDLEAAVQLAEFYAFPPKGGHINMEAAIYWWQFAASKGYVPAYHRMGWFYMSSQAIDSSPLDADEPEARRWFALGVEQDDAACEYGMAMLEKKSHRGGESEAIVRRLLLKSAEKNYPMALLQLGKLSEQASPPNLSEAAEWYRRGMDAGNRVCAERLTRLTLSGAVKPWTNFLAQLRQASALEDSEASYQLALKYLNGEAKPRNDTETPMALLQSSARFGNASAMLKLSDLYRTGTGVGKDLIEAVDWLFHAARRDSSEAYTRIARLRNGARQPADDSQDATEWQQAFIAYTDAMQTSRPDPAVLLARRYLDGTYGTNSYRALVWYAVAAERHDLAAAAEVQRLASTMEQGCQKQVEGEAMTLNFYSQRNLPGFE